MKRGAGESSQKRAEPRSTESESETRHLAVLLAKTKYILWIMRAMPSHVADAN